MTTLPIALAIDTQMTQHNLVTLFSGFKAMSVKFTTPSPSSDLLIITQGSTIYRFSYSRISELWFLSTIDGVFVHIKVNNLSLESLLDSYAHHAQIGTN